MSFRFETQDVPVPATAWINERMSQRRGGWVFGRIGTGKSHAVRKAVQGGLRVDITPGPLLSQRFAADLARQMPAEGRSLLEAFRSEGLEASLLIADRVVNGHPFVVDGVDGLISIASSLDDPATTLWQDEKATLLGWLRGRLDTSPTFLVGRRQPRDVGSCLEHKASKDWPIRLTQTRDGFRDWPLLGQLAGDNPAVLTLARALVPLLPASAFNALVDQAREDEATVPLLLQRLGQAFQSSAPPSWQKLLSLVAALGGIPRDTLVHLFARPVDAGPVSREPLPEELPTLDRLRELKLIQEQSGVISLLPALIDAGAIRSLTDNERENLLPAVADALLAPINDPRSLAPEQTDRVLRAHAIYIELGNMVRAEQTAALHVHGLVDLARRTSLNECHREAWQQYDQILRMMETGPWSTGDRIGRRLLSYVRHYRSRNGALARVLDDATCLTEYRQALADWPENALWHQRVIESLIRLVRPVDAVQAVREAYEHVEPHPRRDELLRVRPAGTAQRSGLPLLSLELIEPVLGLPEDLYPEVVDGCASLLRRWEKGLKVPELPFHPEGSDVEGRIVFHAPLQLEVRKAGESWVARLHGVAHEGRAELPRAALESLARYIASDARRLFTTPSSNLDARDVRLKGRLLSLVDALNSDIGIGFAAERWVVGRIVDSELVPTMRHLPPIKVPSELLPESTKGLYFACAPVHRDGVPSGQATKLVPAGSGHGTGALLELLARMSEDAA